jgi:uncharacterized protein YbaA (DUF1428 family)
MEPENLKNLSLIDRQSPTKLPLVDYGKDDKNKNIVMKEKIEIKQYHMKDVAMQEVIEDVDMNDDRIEKLFDGLRKLFVG